MAKVLIAYATGNGQTERVAARIADVLARSGHQTVSADVRAAAPILIGEFDAVLIGAPVRFGKHHAAAIQFCRDHAALLRARQNALFSISMSAAGDKPGAFREVAKAVGHFIQKSAWVPARVEPIGGALKYTQYGTLLRAVMRAIAKMAGHSTDTSRDHEYTDWEQVDRFARQFAAALPPAAAAARPAA